MIIFPDQPDTDPFYDPKALNDTMYVLRQDYLYISLSGLHIPVPKGYDTDEASIPRVAWSPLGIIPDGYYRAMGVVHDELYSKNGKYSPDKPALTRKECDGILLEIAMRSKMSWLQRHLIYWAVRLFGGGHWKPCK